MKEDDGDDTLDVITGAFSIYSYLVTMLFDFGVGYSFATSDIFDKLELLSSSESPAISVTMPMDTVSCRKLFRGYPILKAGQ